MATATVRADQVDENQPINTGPEKIMQLGQNICYALGVPLGTAITYGTNGYDNLLLHSTSTGRFYALTVTGDGTYNSGDTPQVRVHNTNDGSDFRIVSALDPSDGTTEALLVQRNSGTDDSPTWTTVMKIMNDDITDGKDVSLIGGGGGEGSITSVSGETGGEIVATPPTGPAVVLSIRDNSITGTVDTSTPGLIKQSSITASDCQSYSVDGAGSYAYTKVTGTTTNLITGYNIKPGTLRNSNAYYAPSLSLAARQDAYNGPIRLDNLNSFQRLTSTAAPSGTVLTADGTGLCTWQVPGSASGGMFYNFRGWSRISQSKGASIGRNAERRMAFMEINSPSASWAVGEPSPSATTAAWAGGAGSWHYDKTVFTIDSVDYQITDPELTRKYDPQGAITFSSSTPAKMRIGAQGTWVCRFYAVIPPSVEGIYNAAGSWVDTADYDCWGVILRVTHTDMTYLKAQDSADPDDLVTLSYDIPFYIVSEHQTVTSDIATAVGAYEAGKTNKYTVVDHTFIMHQYGTPVSISYQLIPITKEKAGSGHADGDRYPCEMLQIGAYRLGVGEWIGE